MKTINELKAIVNKWWVYNQTLAQVAEAGAMSIQIADYESGFENYQTDGYVEPITDFQLVRCKDVQNGISLRIESGTNVIDGILNTKSGILELKDIQTMNTTGSLVFRGASMSGQ